MNGLLGLLPRLIIVYLGGRIQVLEI